MVGGAEWTEVGPVREDWMRQQWVGDRTRPSPQLMPNKYSGVAINEPVAEPECASTLGPMGEPEC